MRTTIITYLFLLAFSCTKSQTNIDFENTAVGQYTNSIAVNGWTTECGLNTGTNGACPTSTNYVWNQPINEFWIRSTPILGVFYLGNVGQSPLGGAHVAQLNDWSPSGRITKLKTTISVTANNNLLELAYCGFWDGGGHSCCDNPFLNIRFYDNVGSPLGCSNFTVAPTGTCNPAATLSVTQSGIAWTNWKVQPIDLTPFIGTSIRVEISAGDCVQGAHVGMAYVDARLRAQNVLPGLTGFGVPTVDFCMNSSIAKLTAPLGYHTYSWIAPSSVPPVPASQASLSSIVITSPVPGSVYTVNLNTYSGCAFIMTATLAFSQVFFAGIGSSSTCLNGSIGSASVQGIGSGGGYTYTWTNSSNQAISNSSVISGVPAGLYSVAIAAAGNVAASCGTAIATVQIGVGPKPAQTNILNYCGNGATLQVPNGSNFQWHQNGNPITNATNSLYVVNNPTNYAIYTATYSSGGCSDTTHFILNAVTPGTLSVLSNSICPGATIGTATITLQGSQGSALSYSIFSTGITPTFSAAALGNAITNSVTGLTGGGTYAVTLNEGSCYYSTSFSVHTLVPPFNFTISAQQPTICANQNFSTQVTFSNSSQVGSYTYSWSPPIFINGSATQFSLAVSPVTNQGTQTNMVYSVQITPSLGICPQVKSFTLSVIHLITPTISTTPPLCNDIPAYSIQVNPIGGIFSSTKNLFTSNIPVVNPTTLTPGTYSYSYTIVGGTCTSQASDTLRIIDTPVLAISGNTALCQGGSAVLFASGAHSYSWSTSATSASVVLSPTTTTPYTIIGWDLTKTCSDIAIATLRVDECAGIGHINRHNDLKIFPNPVSERINIEFPEDFSVEVYTSNGSLLYVIKGHQTLSIDLTNKPNGLYLFRIKSEYLEEQKKILKQ